MIVAWENVQTIEIDMSQVSIYSCDATLTVYDGETGTRDDWYFVDAGDIPKQFELSEGQNAELSVEYCDYGTVRTLD